MTKVLIGPSVNGLTFSHRFLCTLYDRTGLKYFSSCEPNIGRVPSATDAILVGDMIYYVDTIYNLNGVAMRSDPVVIEIIEQMGYDAFVSVKTKSYKIVEIPDDVEYDIITSDYGEEFIVEKHRIWN